MVMSGMGRGFRGDLLSIHEIGEENVSVVQGRFNLGMIQRSFQRVRPAFSNRPDKRISYCKIQRTVETACHCREKKLRRGLSNDRLSRMAPTNTRGFSSLPAELYHEIASHYGSSHVSSKQQTVYDGKPFERRATLLALSQTCVKLRGIFLPLAWQQKHIQAHQQRHSAQEFSSGLTRLLKVVTLYNPALSSYVKAVNVVVPNDPSTTTFEELAYFLRLLPNLLTIQLLNLQDKFATAFSKAFDHKKCILLRVRTLLIADTAIHLVACCSKVRRVTAVGSCKARFVRILASRCQESFLKEQASLNIFLKSPAYPIIFAMEIL
ncbi:uncharacterized protein LACBIDRAFT_333984 [Laccaria bicolor S238N-H82]|uniref:Predicted protein n=1 Tax=Laccaria bicolor (strain S238N-H82 / ATCC MYA-4686) TaxID=486041 RepID=B0DXQ6_LACBS|nr:uncharacterized protein LACBIDRAFT_333984 [Laccaria bicolor S238N-H82]EDR00657.1 predicted protein [Laccaria bicolor S238N-H82]|eukprot:XP_001888666.1 predicted protein [Laccaria bicolor S238N-H82]